MANPSVVDGAAPTQITVELMVHGKLSKVTLEVTEEDTPSSIALDLVEELELEPSAETLQTVVAQVEAAMDNQGATPAQQEWDAV